MTRAWVALGGNVGDVLESFLSASRLLAEHPELQFVQASGIYRSAPVGSAAGSAYLNAATCWETSLPPLTLLALLQQTELALGRSRDVHWGPRTLDLDLVQLGDTLVQESRLTIPHPAAWYRRFVLDPICEFAGAELHPLHHTGWKELRRRLLQRPLKVAICGGTAESRTAIVETLGPEFRSAELRATETAAETSAASLRIWLGLTPGVPQSRLPLLAIDGSRWGSRALEETRYVLAAALDQPVRISDWPLATGR